MALPFVPEENILGTFGFVVEYIEDNNILNLADYVKHMYICGRPA